MINAHCTVHNKQCTLYSYAQCTMSVNNVQCKVHVVSITNVHCRISVLTVQFIMSIMFKENLTALYPNIPCDVFKKFSASSKEIGQTSHGYVPHSLKTHVQGNIYNLSGKLLSLSKA